MATTKKPAKTSRTARSVARQRDDFDPVIVGNDDLAEGEGVSVIRLDSGRALVVPSSIRNLRGSAWEAVADLQHLASQIHELQTKLDDCVRESREEYGVSWSAIGWSVGTTAEAARQRFGK